MRLYYIDTHATATEEQISLAENIIDSIITSAVSSSAFGQAFDKKVCVNCNISNNTITILDYILLNTNELLYTTCTLEDGTKYGVLSNTGNTITLRESTNASINNHLVVIEQVAKAPFFKDMYVKNDKVIKYIDKRITDAVDAQIDYILANEELFSGNEVFKSENIGSSYSYTRMNKNESAQAIVSPQVNKILFGIV